MVCQLGKCLALELILTDVQLVPTRARMEKTDKTEGFAFMQEVCKTRARSDVS